MSDLTPPPDEPMPDQARARIREELLRTARTGSTAPRWAAPALAAAAVLVVAGVAAWAVQLGGSPDSAGAPATATSSRPTPPPLPPPSAPMSGSQTLPPPLPDPSSPQPGQVGTAPCEEEATTVLPGAEQAVSIPDGEATTSFWVKGEQFVLCDVRAGTTTVQHPLPLDPAVLEKQTYRVSSIYAPTQDGFRSIRVAGGIVPDGAAAYDVSYTFPDGSTEVANTATDDQGRTWWVMVHGAAASGGSEMGDPPIEATVALSGVQRTFRLEWGVDTCAQANHGC